MMSCRLWKLTIMIDYSLPAFPNLVEVELHVGKLVNWDFLPSLLESFPNLEVLIFPKGLVVPKEHGSGFRGFYWHSPKSVPECLISHFRIIEINNFVEMLGEVYFVKSLLEYGEALESIEIECCDLGQKWGMKRKLEKHLSYLESCEKASSSCELSLTLTLTLTEVLFCLNVYLSTWYPYYLCPLPTNSRLVMFVYCYNFLKQCFLEHL